MTQSEADFVARRYRVRHTTHAYDEDVVGCYERGSLPCVPHRISASRHWRSSSPRNRT